MGAEFVSDLFQKIHLHRESADVQRLTVALEKRLRKAVINLPPELEIEEIVPCGSMVDGSRMWEWGYNRCGSRCHGFCGKPEIEYDYLAVLKVSEAVAVEESLCPGYQHASCGHSYEQSCGLYCSPNIKYNCPVCIRRCFRKHVTNNLSEIPEEDGLRNGFTERSHRVIAYDFIWTDCKTVVAPNFCDQSKPVHDMSEVTISVDFLPAFRISPKSKEWFTSDKASSDDVLVSSLQEHYHLVAKSCGYGVCRPKPCFLKSNRIIEMKTLMDDLDIHREVYAVLKFLIPYVICYNDTEISEGTPLRSFISKTAVLHHSKICSQSNPTLFECLKEVLQYLIVSLDTQSLPNFTSGVNVLESGSIYEDTYQVHKHSFHWIIRLLENLPDITHGQYDFYESLKLFQAVRMVKTPCFLTYFLDKSIDEQKGILKQMESDVETRYDAILSLTNDDIIKCYFPNDI